MGLFWHSNKSKMEVDGGGQLLPFSGFTGPSFSRAWRRVIDNPAYIAASEDSKRRFLAFAIEVIKKDIEGSMLSEEFFNEEIHAESMLFPIPGVCHSVRSGEEVEFEGNTVIIRPLSLKKLISAIGDVGIRGFVRNANYTDGDYYPDLKLIIVRNGLHHAAAARIQKQGCAVCDVYRISDAYEKLDIDSAGENWISSVANFPAPKIIDHRFALLYALAKELRVGRGCINRMTGC